MGLSLSLYLLASYSDGYAPGPSTSGFRVLIPYHNVQMRIEPDWLDLHIDAPGFPYPRLILSRFSAGPGVPPHELRQRRVILHLSAVSMAGVLAIVVAALLARREEPSIVLPLIYGVLTALLVLGLGLSADQRFFLRPPDEVRIRETFAVDLAEHLPQKSILNAPSPQGRRPRSLFCSNRWPLGFPRESGPWERRLLVPC
jgi:hypothetical protein